MNPGLCTNCQYSKRLTSSRGSVFYMCALAEQNVQFARYPRLPVLDCAGFKRIEETQSEKKREQ
jgi:hypothetical protein